MLTELISVAAMYFSNTFLADSFDKVLVFCLIIVCMCAHVCAGLISLVEGRGSGLFICMASV